jgi:translation initiation factor IF-1
MSKSEDDLIEAEGEVTDVLPNQMFKVTLDNGHCLIAYTSGRLRQNKIRIILGDRVKLEMSVYDLSKGRIVYRN